MKKWELSILAGFVFCLLISFCNFSNKCNDVRGDVFRLHILANSDSEQDQELKLKVRDAVLQESEKLFAKAHSEQEAIEIAQENIKLFEGVALRVLAENDSDYSVSAEVGKSSFDTRHYGEITMPAGVYDSLIIKIGKAQGKNWWCVMFPQMCLPAASEKDALTLVFDSEQMELVEGGEKYELKFKCVEWYEWFKHTLGQR